MKITMKDISETTGYSISTVSRVLNNSGSISSNARKKIFEAARQAGYKSSPSLLSSSKQQLKNIALIADFHEGEFYASYFYGFLKAAEEANLRISLLNVFNPRQRAASFINEIVSEDYYDGIILFIPELRQSDYLTILKNLPLDYPIVSNALIDNPGMTTITFDGYSGGFQAGHHFHENGYQEIGIVRGPARKAESRFRYNGLKDFIEEQPEMNLIWECEGNFEFDTGIQSFYNLRESGVWPDAVFISNDLMTTGFIETAKSEGITIPEDIAILAYDDLPMCLQSKPLISSIQTDFEELGTATLNALSNRVANSGQPHGMLSLVPVTINVRESSVKTEKVALSK